MNSLTLDLSDDDFFDEEKRTEPKTPKAKAGKGLRINFQNYLDASLHEESLLNLTSPQNQNTSTGLFQ